MWTCHFFGFFRKNARKFGHVRKKQYFCKLNEKNVI